MTEQEQKAFDQMREAHRKLIRAYVNLLESGRDRIISLGGTCDPVDRMEAGDPALREAKEALTAANAVSHAKPETTLALEGGAITSKSAANAVSHPQATEPAWRPIESAPKDGTVIDLWHEEFGRWASCSWGLPEHTCGEAGSLCDDDVHSMEAGWVTDLNEITFPANEYTHWMPLPAAPVAP